MATGSVLRGLRRAEHFPRAMAQTRRYTVEVKDAASRAVVVAAALDWTIAEKEVAVSRIFRLPGLAGGKGLVHRLSRLHTPAGKGMVAKRNRSKARRRR